MIEFLKRKNPYPNKIDSISLFAVKNRFDLLQIVYRETDDFLENFRIIDYSANYGKLEVVQFLTETGASCSVNALDFAARKGHLEVVKFLHLNRSEGCYRALLSASKYGHFEVVKYLVENSLGMNRIQRAIELAEEGGHLKIVKYLEDYVGGLV